ncbi:MAG TPA: hypothetical protein VNL77_19130 [Roseiflexaceae bacterium]|nr:hypothetical protein [Roseiflexaceae bacterium]
MQTTLRYAPRGSVPLLELLHPRQHTRLLLVVLALGVVGATVAVQLLGVKLWMAAAGALAALVGAAALKWREDWRRYGQAAMVLSALVALQGFHTVEHVAQWFQYHVLRWPTFVSSGLISAADAEWVHFVWNWGFLLVCMYLVARGMRSWWAWLLLAWATAHTFEHSYMMWRYLRTVQELAALGVSGVSAQGLPGILGRDGWLATADATQGTFLCRLPGLTTAVRLDVHFWWNVGELALLLPAANAYMRRILKTVTNHP